LSLKTCSNFVRSIVKKVISVIYDFIETEKDATYEISVTNNNVTGNFVQGNVGGDVRFNSDD